ncbi:unnamed protein product [Closterium sp. NIES-54]
MLSALPLCTSPPLSYCSLSETFASTGDLSSTSKEPPPTAPVTPGAHQLGWRFSFKVQISSIKCCCSFSSLFRVTSLQPTVSLFPVSNTPPAHPTAHPSLASTCLQGGGFLVEACQEMVLHSKADCPYGVCRCRQWVPSSDTAVVLVSTAEDMQGCPPSTSKSVPPPTAAASPSAAAAAGGSAVEGQPREPVVVVFRVRLDKIRVEAEQHNDKVSSCQSTSGVLCLPLVGLREIWPYPSFISPIAAQRALQWSYPPSCKFYLSSSVPPPPPPTTPNLHFTHHLSLPL